MPKKTKKNKKNLRNARKPYAALANHCWFCEKSTEPDYKNIEVLKNCLTPRGKILPRSITAICAKHQRVLSNSVKIAREMALLR